MDPNHTKTLISSIALLSPLRCRFFGLVYSRDMISFIKLHAVMDKF
ncbi:hypothetical protein I3843_16G012600 [Carya illinoinensis]|nr:hypothetical protein I3843_16G012600 [Carya illinoinensis]